MAGKSKGKGNKRAQNLRRKARLSAFYERYKFNNPNIKSRSFELIDGNMSYYPVAFCQHHGAYMTEGLVKCHRCDKRHCKYFQEVTRDNKGNVLGDCFRENLNENVKKK